MATSADRDGAMPGTNLAQTRTLNRRAVFDAVRRGGPITRTELAKTIGLTVQAISNIASELEVAGLIRQQGKRLGQRGQPAVELSLDPAGGYTIGLSLAYRRVSGVLVDLTGTVVASEAQDLIEREPALIAQTLGTLVNRLVETSGIQRQKIWGIGCSVPGTVENGTFWYDKVQEADEWTKFPLAAKLEELTGVRTFVENDATVAAIGERLYGIGRVARSFFYLHFNLGVGGGLVMDGHHYRGAFGGAGEIGHMIVKPGGRLCPCGSRGCLEQYVSFYSAAETICGPTRTPDEVPAEELAACFRAGDARLLAWQQEAGQYLKIAIRNVEAMLDPDTVVIGGGLPLELLDGIIAAAAPLLPTMTHRHSNSHPRLMRAEHAAELPALGAAALPIAIVMQPGTSGASWRATISKTPMAANPALAALGIDSALE
ncbi:ROK family transcriptional regulator [Rhizobium sp. A22-96]